MASIAQLVTVLVERTTRRGLIVFVDIRRESLRLLAAQTEALALDLPKHGSGTARRRAQRAKVGNTERSGAELAFVSASCAVHGRDAAKDNR
jgi:hypothetical protein